MGNLSRRSRLGATAAVALFALSVAVPAHASPVTAPSGRVSGTAIPLGGPGLSGKGVHVSYAAGATKLPPVAASSWVVADLTTGEILAAKAPHLTRPPASTLKTLTALTLIPQLDPKRVYRSQVSDVMVEGSRAGLVDRGTYTVDDLFYGLLLPSGNDAARALAHANGGVKKTVAEMNEVARHLQAVDTVAKTPHGLDTPGQVSSAYDLALIARAALQLPGFRTYVSTLRYDFPGKMPKAGKKRKTFELWNQNPLLREGYRGVIGVKTGYTTLAGRTFVGRRSVVAHTLVVTLMGVTEPTVNASSKLLTWGFKAEGHVTPVGTLVDPGVGHRPGRTPAASARDSRSPARHRAGRPRPPRAPQPPGRSLAGSAALSSWPAPSSACWPCAAGAARSAAGSGSSPPRDEPADPHAMPRPWSSATATQAETTRVHFAVKLIQTSIPIVTAKTP